MVEAEIAGLRPRGEVENLAELLRVELTERIGFGQIAVTRINFDDFVSALFQFAAERRAEEACAAGHQNFHASISFGSTGK